MLKQETRDTHSYRRAGAAVAGEDTGLWWMDTDPRAISEARPPTSQSISPGSGARCQQQQQEHRAPPRALGGSSSQNALMGVSREAECVEDQALSSWNGV